jgi:hypothetical protein
MRILLTILLLISLQAGATNYYISNAGSDAANGLTTGTSWQTIAKVNASSFSPGDQILFKTGDTWIEQLKVSWSGSIGNPIIISSYGSGLKPLITGFQTLTGFTNTSGNIWSATASNSVINQNTVMIGGYLRAKARYPNTSYLLTNAPSTTTTINTALTGTPSYVGAEIVFGPGSFIWDVLKVTAQSTGTLTVSPAATYSSSGNNNYFFQNQISFLDVQNEWVYDPTTKLLSIYSTTAPNVQISTIDSLCYYTKNNYITFDGLSFTGANKIALGFDTSNYIVVKNCLFNNNGLIALQHSASRNNTFSKDSILNTLSVGIWTYYRSPQTIIDSCFISRSGLLVGMAASGNLTSMAMFAAGDSSMVTNNVIDSSGYIGIFWSGVRDTVRHNYVTNYGINKTDVGGIYTNGRDTGAVVRSNIVGNGNTINYICPGIYLDAPTYDVTVDSNTVYNCFVYGILLNTAVKINLNDNTIVNNIGVGYSIQGGSPGNNSYFKRNVVYIQDTTKVVLYIASSVINTMDSNYYVRPGSAYNIIYNQNINTYYNLSAWTTASGFDANTKQTPANISTAPGILYTNPTLVNKTITFNGFRIDAKGNQYTGAVVIKPFQSIILFNSIQPITGRIKNLNFQ